MIYYSIYRIPKFSNLKNKRIINFPNFQRFINFDIKLLLFDKKRATMN